MNVIVKHMIEIAGGIIIGSLAGDAANKVIDVTKAAIVNHKEKKGAK